jgi:hypothetical protein
MALSDHVIKREQIPAEEFEQLEVNTSLQAQLLSFKFAKNNTVLGTVLIDGRTASAVLGQNQSISDMMAIKGQDVIANFRGMREVNGNLVPSLAIEV